MLDDDNEISREPHKNIVQVILFVRNRIVINIFYCIYSLSSCGKQLLIILADQWKI